MINLARTLLAGGTDGAEPTGSIAETDMALLRAFLLRGPRSVTEWCSEGILREGANLLLLVDQLEELFRYQDYAGREDAEAFAALLIESARQRRFPIYVVLTMRSEYLGACALVEGLAEAISAGMFLIPRMSRTQCRSAIVGPATVCGFAIEEALANRLLNDLAAFTPWDDRGTGDQLDRLGRRADQLPLLQYCLNRMWVRAREAAAGLPGALGVVDYERIGGLGGALNAHANEILESLGSERPPIAEARISRADRGGERSGGGAAAYTARRARRHLQRQRSRSAGCRRRLPLSREYGGDRKSEIKGNIPLENMSADQGATLANVSDRTMRDAVGRAAHRRAAREIRPAVAPGYGTADITLRNRTAGSTVCLRWTAEARAENPGFERHQSL